MARYIGPVCRLSRREKTNLFPRSIRCSKVFANRGDQVPGMHIPTRQKMSDYGIRLREKQKVRHIYGILEKQFRTYYAKASHAKGVTGHMLLTILERRLDNAVYRMGFVSTRRQARQAVTHGHVQINGRRVNIPSFQVSAGDVITLKATDKMKEQFKLVYEQTGDQEKIDWLTVDTDAFTATVKRLPERVDVQMPIQEQLVVEFYSR